jgi:hypothetical protein
MFKNTTEKTNFLLGQIKAAENKMSSDEDSDGFFNSS